MNVDRKTLLAFLLIGATMLFVWSPYYQKLFYPEAYQQKQLEKKMQSSQVVKEEINQEPTETENINEPIVNKVQEPVKPVNPVKSEPEKLITVNTDLYKATFSTNGAVLKQFQLKEYFKPDSTTVYMLPKGNEGNFAISYIDSQGDTVDTVNWSFLAECDSVISLNESEEQSISFVYNFDQYRQIIKKFTFSNSHYDFEMNIIFKNLENTIYHKMYFVNIPAGLESTEKRLNEDMNYAKAAVYAGQDINKGYKPNGKTEKETGDINWVGVRTKYFALALAPEKKATSAAITGYEIAEISNPKLKWKQFIINLQMPFLGESNLSDNYMIYMGPLEHETVKSYNIGLEKFMDFGWKIIQPFSLVILWSFKKLHSFIPNYGWALIIFSILIKLIVYPLTHKSYQSMKKMQTLQPKVAELKEKYKKDPQRLQKETMALYKAEGANPMGGCLPMLLQMPLLYGLFIIFRTTIELRGEPFMFWIKDLSQPDTIATLPFSIPMYGDSVNILPIFMGITMIIQQKMSITDPKQKAMVYMMPIVFTLLFNSFPSGLNLYYALFNLLTIAQQKWLSGGTATVNVSPAKTK